jgi:DNA-binding CsgD family transcriptional regulator
MKRPGKIDGSGRKNELIPSAAVGKAPHNGYPCLSQGARAIDAEGWREIRRGLKLSARELQIIQGIFDNKLEFTIATELGISVNTVHTQVRRLRGKLDATDRLAIALCVMEEFLRLTTSDETQLPAICRNHSAGRCPFHPLPPVDER